MSQWPQFERCPAPAEVLLACEGELPFAQGQRVLAHVQRCESCQEVVRSNEAVPAAVSSQYLSLLDATRPTLARRHDFDLALGGWKQAPSMPHRDGWVSRRMIPAAAIVLIAVTGFALPSAYAEGLGGMLARIVATVRQTLSFEPAASGGLRQARSVTKSERLPAPPPPAPDPSESESAESADTARQAATAAMAALPDRDMLEQAELDARLVLSDASLDLLRGIHVSSNHKAVRVEGTLPSPRRRVVARLNALPYVRVSLRPGPAAAGDMNAAGAAVSVTGLSRWVDYRLGDRPEKQTFVPEMTRLATTLIGRVQMLHALAERYSDGVVKEMSPAARAKLQKLVDRHYQSLSDELDALDARFAILFGSTTRVFPTRRAPSDWQTRVNDGFTHAEGSIGRCAICSPSMISRLSRQRVNWPSATRSRSPSARSGTRSTRPGRKPSPSALPPGVLFRRSDRTRLRCTDIDPRALFGTRSPLHAPPPSDMMTPRRSAG